MIAVGGCPDDVSAGTYVTWYCLAVEKLKGTTGQLEASIYRSSTTVISFNRSLWRYSEGL